MEDLKTSNHSEQRDMAREEELSAALARQNFRRLKEIRPIFFRSIDSTQSYISSELKSTREGDLVISDVQTSGRGRGGRSWVSNEGGLWMTITLRPLSPTMLPSIIEIAAKSIVTTLQEYRLTNCYVKRPNDVYCRDRKIAGVLADSIVSGEESTVYLGIGVNVNNDTSKNRSISGTATSVLLELGTNIDLRTFTVSLLQNLDGAYNELLSKIE